MGDIPRFNYIITIHNKEKLIENVISAALMCCRDNSHIYTVLDGCTDNTELIIDHIIKKFAGVPITKIYTPDVHEIKSINAGLKAANHQGEGYNIILQDDVILADFLIENKISKLYQWAGPNLGYLSLRLGANFKKDAYATDDATPYIDYVENAYGHGIKDAKVLLPGHFAYRTVGIKSPACIPFKLIRELGIIDERLAPYCHDDLEYSIRAIQNGYFNGVFSIRFYSDIEWGGTRTIPHPEMNQIIYRNMNLVREWHRSDLKKICINEQKNDVFFVPNQATDDEIKTALEYWTLTTKKLEAYQSRLNINLFSKIMQKIKYLHKKSRNNL